MCDFLNCLFVYCQWHSLYLANTAQIGADVNLCKYKHQNVPIAYPNSKYKCHQFRQFSMSTKNKQSSAKCLVLVDKLQAYWSCSLTKLYRRLVPPQLTAARRRRHCRGGLNSLYRTYRASTMVVLEDFLSKKRQFLILGTNYQQVKNQKRKAISFNQVLKLT